MQVKVRNRIYQMGTKEYKGLLQVASEQVPLGIYAVEKQGYAELRYDKCTSITQLKKLTREFKVQGYRVLSNKGESQKETGKMAAEGVRMSAT